MKHVDAFNEPDRKLNGHACKRRYHLHAGSYHCWSLRTIRGVDQWGFIGFLVEMVCTARDREGEGELGLGTNHR